MTDEEKREKVIRGLEICSITPLYRVHCHNCPYNNGNSIGCMVELMKDAIALLKEQEGVKRTSRTGANGYSLVWTCGNCGSDLHPNNAKAKYCSNCGKAVKWK